MGKIKKVIPDSHLLDSYKSSGTSPPLSNLSILKAQVIDPRGTSLIENKIDERSPGDRWLTSAEAAEYLRIPIGTLRNMASNGQIPHYKLGRLNRYLESDLKKLLLSQKRGV